MIVLELINLVLCLYKMTIWSLLFDHFVKVYGRNFLFECLDLKEQICQHSYS